MAKITKLIITGIWLALIAACGDRVSIDVIKEEDETTYRRAKELIERGKNDDALKNLLKLIQKRDGNAPESHLEAGRLYLTHVKDPYSAIYHFNRFERLQQNRLDQPMVKRKLSLVEDLKNTAQKEILTSYPASVYRDSLERLKLLDTIEALRAENEALKQSLAQANQSISLPSAASIASPSASRANANAEVSVPAEESTRTYVVKKGDTLYSISIQFYGTSARIQSIVDANRAVLPDADRLQVGMELMIP